MSENEIKPLAWMVDEQGMTGQLGTRLYWARNGGTPPSFGQNHSPLYDQSAIDALTKQISELKTMLSIAEFQRKEMQAERDAAVADAERRLQLIRDTLANTEWRHGAHNIHRELKAEVRSADAARSLDDSPMARMASALREKAAVERSQYDKRVQSGEWGPMPELGAEAVFCVACDGAGWDGDSRERTCQSCAGSGLAARSEGGV